MDFFEKELVISKIILAIFMKKETEHSSSARMTLEAIRPALDYINENYTQENIPLSHLAGLCGQRIYQTKIKRQHQTEFSD